MRQPIISPVSGVVRTLDAGPALTFGIYIRGPNDPVHDSHDIYAPFDARIKSIDAHAFTRVGRLYTIRPEKHGSLIITFIGHDPAATHTHAPTHATLEIEVGSGYVTNEIAIGVVPGQFVKAGARIGSIVIRPGNSYARFRVSGRLTPKTRVGHVVIGGKTTIAEPS